MRAGLGRCSSLALALVLAAGPAVAQGSAEGPLQAGAGRADISPAKSQLQYGEFLRDPLNARAIVVSNGVTCAVLVGLDQANAADAVVAAAMPRVAAESGCAADNILISGTHTHSGNTAGLQEQGAPGTQAVADGIVAAVKAARASLRPTRIGYGTTQLDLNVNRDVFDGTRWFQGTNSTGPSDKTLAVVEFLDAKGMPIGVYMNYAMHPINMFLSGAISGDFAGEASRYVEKRFPGSVAIYAQAAAGDQNPRLTGPLMRLGGIRTRVPGAADTSIDAPDPWVANADRPTGFMDQLKQFTVPLKPAEKAAWQRAYDETDELVRGTGAIVGETVIDVMRNLTPVKRDTARIAGAQATVTCPGRERTDHNGFQGVQPTYRDAEPIPIKLGMIRIGDVDLAWVNGEVYSEIATRLKREAPSRQLMMVTLANGRGPGDYIASDAAGSHLTFQVIGSRLKPGCAEGAIVDGQLKLLDATSR